MLAPRDRELRIGAGSKERLALVGAGIFTGLAAVAAVAWWLSLPRRLDAFPWSETGLVSLFLIGFAVVQLLALLLAIRLVVRASRSSHSFLAWLALVVGLVLFCANALNFFAPAVGAPILVVVGFAGFGRAPEPG